MTKDPTDPTSRLLCLRSKAIEALHEGMDDVVDQLSQVVKDADVLRAACTRTQQTWTKVEIEAEIDALQQRLETLIGMRVDC